MLKTVHSDGKCLTHMADASDCALALYYLKKNGNWSCRNFRTHFLKRGDSLDLSFNRILKFHSCLSTLQSERRQLFWMQKDPKIEKKFVSRKGNPPPPGWKKSLDFVYRTGPSKISNSGQPGKGCQPGDKLFI